MSSPSESFKPRCPSDKTLTCCCKSRLVAHLIAEYVKRRVGFWQSVMHTVSQLAPSARAFIELFITRPLWLADPNIPYWSNTWEDSWVLRALIPGSSFAYPVQLLSLCERAYRFLSNLLSPVRTEPCPQCCELPCVLPLAKSGCNLNYLFQNSLGIANPQRNQTSEREPDGWFVFRKRIYRGSGFINSCFEPELSEACVCFIIIFPLSAVTIFCSLIWRCLSACGAPSGNNVVWHRNDYHSTADSGCDRPFHNKKCQVASMKSALASTMERELGMRDWNVRPTGKKGVESILF